MKVSEAIKKRRSTRQFDRKKTISDKQIKALLEAARWAPSAGNLQSRYLIVVKDSKTKKKLALAALGQIWVAQAPIVIVACADLKKIRPYGKRGRELYAIQDATLALYNLWLTAVEMGLGGVWVGAFSEKMVSKILNLENHLRPVAMLPIGHPAKTPTPKPRRSIKEFSKTI
ncbi:nitroreductase family protein [Patescibacteria group bacterium]